MFSLKFDEKAIRKAVETKAMAAAREKIVKIAEETICPTHLKRPRIKFVGNKNEFRVEACCELGIETAHKALGVGTV